MATPRAAVPPVRLMTVDDLLEVTHRCGTCDSHNPGRTEHDQTTPCLAAAHAELVRRARERDEAMFNSVYLYEAFKEAAHPRRIIKWLAETGRPLSVVSVNRYLMDLASIHRDVRSPLR